MAFSSLVTAMLGATVSVQDALTYNTQLEAAKAKSVLCDPACPWDTGLTIGCTTPKLQASFTKITHYSGIIDCGNLFLDADLGSAAHYQSDYGPWVQFPTADDGKLYSIIMYDPDANMNGSYPVVTVGSLAPIRHMVLGNIKGSDMVHGFSTGRAWSHSTVVTPFAAPAPPIGSHRYAIFLFEQKGTEPMTFPTYNNNVGSKGTERFNWNVAKYITDYKLGTPVASNWFIAMHSPDDYTPYP